MMRLFVLGQTMVELHDSGLTVTRYEGDAQVPAWPEDSDEYRARAEALGYGDDVFRMSRDHELLHTMLSVAVGLPYSPTLHNVAHGGTGQGGLIEEEMVLAAQRFCNKHGINVAKRFILMSEGK